MVQKRGNCLMCTYIYIHTYIHTYIHAYIHTYIHTHIYTHMNAQGYTVAQIHNIIGKF